MPDISFNGEWHRRGGAAMATVPFEFECDRAAGFVMDPNEHKCVGYVTRLGGFGLTSSLAADLKVSLPFSGSIPTYTGLQPAHVAGPVPAMTANVVGVMEKFTWSGGVGDPFEIDFWCSQENAFQIKALQQTTLKSTIVDPLGWWIGDYDQEAKMWYEKSFPLGTSGIVAGTIANKENPELNVDLKGTFAKDGIDVLVYKISMKVVPGANKEYAIRMANSSAKPVSKQWGLVIGTLSSGQYKNA
jgi:hypothetical protein